MGNVIIIGRDEAIPKIRDKIQNSLKGVKKLGAKKYLGKVKIKDAALAYQRRIRKEWNRNELTD